MRSFEKPHSTTTRESFSPSSDSRAPANQAYVDLLKASWILYEIVLQDEYLDSLYVEENQKLCYDLSEVS